MPRDRAAPEAVLSEVVRQRLAALLDEVPARRAIGPVPTEEPEPPAEPAPAVAAESAARARVPQPAELARLVWEFTRAHLVAVAVVLLTGCLWAGYNVLQARSTPVVPVTTPTVVASPTPTPTPQVVLVHVLGAVRRPGLVQLPDGARVADAIEAAGGLTDDADPGELNLAAVLSDGAQVVIGVRGEPRGELRGAGSPGSGGEGEPLSLNTATQAQLETLPGVGPVTAQKIIAWREAHERFTRVEELQEVDGIGPKTFAQIEPHVRV